MQAYTEEQRNELIAFNKEKLAGLKFAVKQHALKSVRGELQKELATTEIALVALEAKPVGYGMQRKDNATFGSWLKPKHLVKENLIYRPAPLYLAQPVVAPAVPDGWKLVPVIAFPSQWAAGQKAFDSAGMNKVDAVYKAMVAAAPEVE